MQKPIDELKTNPHLRREKHDDYHFFAHQPRLVKMRYNGVVWSPVAALVAHTLR
jgi:hypothetical protein